MELVDDSWPAFVMDQHGSEVSTGFDFGNFATKGKTMIQRYGEISDGKRFHAIQRDTNGQWVRYDDHAQELENQRLQYINLIANRCAAFGGALPSGLTFNAAIENLIKCVQSAEQEKSSDVVVRLKKSSQTLLTMNAPIAAMLTQEAAEEIERLRDKVESYPKRN